ncbi:hypothetical protein BDZ85DRAFT_261188 [Elsinoe ampelina]|uniref:Major facilitator superfamily domain-containing protein n=1 Tax=Elsinoe ampelina TaxID=302913 RepID=A0A6A6GFR2_9PEZI|nr:hypothetical protein BDZ85DRAFT_261188 [Elsinoe ampelina]
MAGDSGRDGLQQPSTTNPLASAATETDALLPQHDNKDAPPYRGRWFLVKLVLGMAGVQVAFSVQFSTGVSYFRSLGISQTVSTLVWFIPPACGAFVQPLFGRWSDARRTRLPFVFFGGLATVLSLLGYAWTPNLAGLISGRDKPMNDPAVVKASQALVIFFFIALNISVQPVQSGLRALIVDEVNETQQVEANAWSSRVNHVAAIIAYLAAASSMTEKVLLGPTHLQALVNLSVVVVVLSVGVTSYTVKVAGKRSVIVENEEPSQGMFATWKLMSPRLRRIYFAQFFSWFAWYPVLVQITSFIDSLGCSSASAASDNVDNSNCTPSGATALFNQSVVAFIMSLILPALIYKISTSSSKSGPSFERERSKSELRSLQTLWAVAQILFAVFLSTSFFQSRLLIIIAIGLNGLCWCVSAWVPFVFANEEVIQIEEKRKGAALEPRSGVLIGAHNTFIASPQILTTAFSSLLFLILDVAGISDPVGNILWLFGLAVISALVSALLVWRL